MIALHFSFLTALGKHILLSISVNLTTLGTSQEKAMAPHSSTLAWRIPRQRSLVGCSPWGLGESDTTEGLHFHFSLSRIGEGNGKPLQCSCLENPKDGGAWWAAVYGVAQSRTRLKRLSSSGSSSRRLSQICLSVSTSLRWRHGSTVWPQAKQQGGNSAHQ